MEIFFIRLIIKSLSTGLSPEFLRQIKNSLAEINLYTQACLAESQAEFMVILSVQSMALVAFHIHVDNLIVDAVNIVTMDLFIFNFSKIFYCYNCSIYIFPGPASASMISATKPHLSSRTRCIRSLRALDNPELDSLDEHNQL